MSILATIKADWFAKRKEATDKAAIALLTTLYSEAANVGLNDGKRESTDSEVMAVVKKFIKNLDECIAAGTSKGVDISGYEVEKSILSAYVPTQMSEAELEAIIVNMIQDGNNKGLIMKALKGNHDGQYDGKLAASIIDRNM